MTFKPEGKKGVVLPDGTFEEQEFTAEELAEFEDWNNKLPTIQLANLRFQRNKLLAETDWMAGSDVTMSNAWKTYRQQLRDLPSTTDPSNPTWPTAPEND